MINIKEQSLTKALEASACRSLPKVFNEDGHGIWIKAIALVKKRDFSQSYCLVERRGDGMVQYTADFGSSAPIYGLLAIYPYIMLDKSKYLYGSEIELKRALVRMYELSEDEVDAFTKDELQDYNVQMAIQRQMEDVKRYDEYGIKDYEPDYDEDGFVDIFSAKKQDESTELIAEDGSKEEFVEIASAQPRTKRGRKPKK